MTRSKQDKPKRHRFSFPAKFISFEGIDGCGKSTLMDQLSNWLTRAGIPCVRTREPGGTPIGEKIREILLDPAFPEMSSRAEVLLYSASRAQLTDQVIVSAMKKGSWVLTDRFVDATFAYQGFGRGFDLERLRIIQEWTTKDLWPDKTILLDCDIDTAMARLADSGWRRPRPDRAGGPDIPPEGPQRLPGACPKRAREVSRPGRLQAPGSGNRGILRKVLAGGSRALIPSRPAGS